MLDFNSTSAQADYLKSLLDAGIARDHALQPPRDYLGASRVGDDCARKLQYEYAQAAVDPGAEFSPQLLRIFDRGHAIEQCVVRWLRLAGFTVLTRTNRDEPIGFSVDDGRFRGHVDGVVTAGPAGFGYPFVFENKCVGHKSFRDISKAPLAQTRPVYAAQVALYQAYLQLHEYPALFVAVNADTMQLHCEWVPFDAALAQRSSDSAVEILTATEHHELLPRAFNDPAHHVCRMCPYAQRCWTAPS